MEINQTPLKTETIVKIANELALRLESLSESKYRDDIEKSFSELCEYIEKRESKEFLTDNVICPDI